MGVVGAAGYDQRVRRRDPADHKHDRPHGDVEINEPVQAIEMRATRDERRVFVAMGRANRVAELDPASGKVLRWWPTGQRTWGIGLSPDETRLYAASGLSGTVTTIDLTRNKVMATVKLGGRPWGAVAAPR